MGLTQMEKTVVLPRLLTQGQLAEYLHKSEAWAERARWDGSGPPYVKLGRHVRYRAEDVEAWIAGALRTSTSEVA
jgi:predicted DNA-binding transcriptional regulator AlpA